MNYKVAFIALLLSTSFIIIINAIEQALAQRRPVMYIDNVTFKLFFAAILFSIAAGLGGAE